MSILIDKNTRLVVQGITGRDGSFHSSQMMAYGTHVVAGVTPGKGGTKFEEKVPVFDSVHQAVDATGANTSVIYVRAPFAADAICEAADAGIRFVVCITEGVPVRDMLRVVPFLKERSTRLLGPNCPGLIAPNARVKVGILPGNIVMPGSVGVVSRSGTLTYEVVFQLTRAGLGQSTCIGIGGDPVIGTNFIDTLRFFQADDETEAIVMIGEIGGSDEEEAAAFIKEGDQAGGFVHRGADRAARQTHGSCRRDRHRWQRHRRRQDQGAHGGRRSGCAGAVGDHESHHRGCARIAPGVVTLITQERQLNDEDVVDGQARHGCVR